MKIKFLLFACITMGLSQSALAATTTYTDETAFLAASGAELFHIDFNGITPATTGNGVFAGQVDFGSPEASDPDLVFFNSGAMTDNGSTIASNNVGPVDGDFLTGDSVYGFSMLFSSSGSPQTVSIFELGGGLIDSVLTPAGGFFGLVSDTRVGSFVIDNGLFPDGNPDRFFIDDFKAYGASPIPVPAAVWLFGTALAGLLGWRRRGRRA